MSKKKTSNEAKIEKANQWTLRFNQEGYAFLMCPHCGNANEWNILKTPTNCKYCGKEVDGVKNEKTR